MLKTTFPKTIPMRRMQREYKKVIEEARKNKAPLFLTKGSYPQAVILDIDVYERMASGRKKKKKVNWKRIEADMQEISKAGKKISLVDFLIKDRESH